MTTQRKKGRQTGGRRANYAPSVEQSEFRRKYLPITWANWLGFILFSLITIALLVETIDAIRDERGADPIAAGVMTLAFGVTAYLFATTRSKNLD